METALKGAPGVQEAAVSLVTHKAEVSSPSNNLHNCSSLCGGPPSNVLDYSCSASCAQTLHIREPASAALHCTAQVTFDPDVVGPRTLLEVVEGIGYDATLEDDSDDDGDVDPTAADRRFWRRKICWSVVFTVPVFLLGMVCSTSDRCILFRQVALRAPQASTVALLLCRWLFTQCLPGMTQKRSIRR